MIIAAATAAGPASFTTAVLSYEDLINFIIFAQSVPKFGWTHVPIVPYNK